ncbi:ABC-type transport auxiliary lipoprotein family protein [Aureimonas psammosilenae]|uniref:ABC-type transport auxiliary lipoprotein family protein n=1 Tax=Aureimonas psammosilenae TaxID=2495496 RepID=UPI0012613180|nr:ABC-type transport auxiliary lipoprotein family protein [Aureimonas psammosilenae]
MSYRYRNLTAIFLAATLGGCAALSGTTPRDTYEISAPTPPAASPARSKLQLLIPDPTAIKALDSNDIVVKPTPFTVEALKNSQWSDRLPRIVQLRMVQAFENTGRVGAVGVPGQGLAIDYQLVMELRRFEIDAEGGRNVATVEIAIKLLNDRNGTVRATRVFTARNNVSGAENSAFVAALDRAFDSVAGEVVSWTLGTV